MRVIDGFRRMDCHGNLLSLKDDASNGANLDRAGRRYAAAWTRSERSRARYRDMSDKIERNEGGPSSGMLPGIPRGPHRAIVSLAPTSLQGFPDRSTWVRTAKVAPSRSAGGNRPGHMVGGRHRAENVLAAKRRGVGRGCDRPDRPDRPRVERGGDEAREVEGRVVECRLRVPRIVPAAGCLGFVGVDRPARRVVMARLAVRPVEAGPRPRAAQGRRERIPVRPGVFALQRRQVGGKGEEDGKQDRQRVRGLGPREQQGRLTLFR